MTSRIVLICALLTFWNTGFAAETEQENSLKVGFNTINTKDNSDISSDTSHSFSPSEARPSSSSNTRPLTTGFYPLVEDTGYTPEANILQMAWNQISYSLVDGINIGTQPALFLFRTPNFFVKARLYQDKKHSVSAKLGANVLLKNSGEFFTTFYSSPIHNPNSSVYVIPVTLSHSYTLNKHIKFHHTVSDINIAAERDIEETATIGYSAIVELRARDRHSVFVHGSEVGFWDHRYYFGGISYRYSTKSFFTQVGYFYRVQTEGVQSLPLIDIGFTL